mgnify:CR=1 FL=1|tara:strand:+ start:1217 stop:2740 length:1524 start_codon:yes stop_codon:yes gene_type:complete
MLQKKRIKNALISVFHKDGLESIVTKLNKLGVNIYSTGGTQSFIEKHGINVNRVEDLTTYPSILGGRVKTLHPNIFGGILSRRELTSDKKQLEKYNIPEFDLIIVDLYPFEKTVISGASEKDIIEKIDIGGISLIRAGAKNFKDVLVVSQVDQYDEILQLLHTNGPNTTIEERKKFAKKAFNISSHYDTAIFKYFAEKDTNTFKESILKSGKLRYGENPHQSGIFYGNLENIFTKLNGKELSYNNLLDIDAAVNLISEFNETTFAILKHNNACGVACRSKLINAWKDALAGDTTSAFGGILITNTEVGIETAKEINNLFYEVLIAPSFSNKALTLLKQKKNRILLQQKKKVLAKTQFRTVLNGVLAQEKDLKKDTIDDMKTVTKIKPTNDQLIDLSFASKICKHTKSNTIVFAKNKQLLASGVGQTSRIDALKQAVQKASAFGFNLKGSVMASDAFFPFPDCVKLAKDAGVEAVIQPGGSIKDQLSIDYCNTENMTMVVTGIRHFKH